MKRRPQVVTFFEDTDYRPVHEISKLPDTSHRPIVYYMRMDRLVKIGYSTNIRRRVEHIGPQGVLAIEFGTKVLERQRHQQFVADHSHLEWFWLRQPLWEHIATVRAAFEAEAGAPTERWLEFYGVESTSIA